MEVLLPAIGLFLLIEGTPYFIAPGGVKRLLERVREVPDHYLRVVGFVAMLVGLVILYLTLIKGVEAAEPVNLLSPKKDSSQIRIAILKRPQKNRVLRSKIMSEMERIFGNALFLTDENVAKPWVAYEVGYLLEHIMEF